MAKILEGIRVLDLSQFISGPFCSMFLADQGAEVIKIEPPGFGEAVRRMVMYDRQVAPWFTILNRNKKSITLNFRKEEAKEIFLKLVERSDIIIENFMPGTMERWGVPYEMLKERKPDLIYGSISGFGQTGPRANIPAFDLIAQAAGGMIHAQNIQEGVPRMPFADYSSGLCMCVGIMQALYYREKTGKGQFVDLSMQDLMFAMNIRAQFNEFMDKAKKNDFSERLLPTYNQYKTKDGLKVILVTITEGQWERMMTVIDREDLLEDERMENLITRFDHVDFLDEVLEEYTLKHEREEIVKVMRKNRIPCHPVLSVDEIYNDEQLESRGMYNREYKFKGVEKATVPNPVLKFSETPGEIVEKAARLGKHNKEIYVKFLGIDPEEFKKLKTNGVI